MHIYAHHFQDGYEIGNSLPVPYHAMFKSRSKFQTYGGCVAVHIAVHRRGCRASARVSAVPEPFISKTNLSDYQYQPYHQGFLVPDLLYEKISMSYQRKKQIVVYPEPRLTSTYNPEINPDQSHTWSGCTCLRSSRFLNKLLSDRNRN